MNWKQTLFKPKWKHKSPEVRRSAVRDGAEPDLIAELPEILAEDEDSGVRAAAARRVSDPGILFDALERESDAGTSGVIAERLRQVVASATAERAPLEERKRIVRASDDRDLHEAVALHAPEPTLRMAALDRIERQGFLGDRAIEDPDPEVRRHAAEAITQHSTLKRIIASTRTSDKGLHQDLVSRLHRELLERGDEEAVRREAQSLCEQLERHLHEGDAGADEIRVIETRWAQVAKQVPEPLARRYHNDLQRLCAPVEAAGDEAAAPSAPPEEPQPPSGGESLKPAPEPESPADARLVEALESLTRAAQSNSPPAEQRVQRLERSWAKAWSAAGSERDEDLRRQAEQLLESLRSAAQRAKADRDEAVQQAQELSQALKRALDDGSLHQALELRAKLQAVGKELGGGPRWKSIQKQLNSALGRLRELRDWQHWANDKIRKRLIGEMEKLPAAGLHPDAVLDRIKTLQAEWKSLEASEQIPGDRHYAAAPWMWRRFNAAGRKAFELTKPYLDKRSEVQDKRLQEMQALAEELSSLAARDDVDLRVLRSTMGRVRKALRSLSSVPAKSRARLARQLKAALEAGNEVVQAHFAEVEKRKLKLIREAQQLTHVADRDEAIREAKALQAAWKAAGSLWRSRENELWQEFRTPLDPLFEQVEAERESQRERHAARRAEQEALCRQLQEILDLNDAELAAQQGKVQGLVDQWQEHRHPDRSLQQKFEQLVKRYHDREEEQRRAAARSERKRIWRQAELVHRAEEAARSGALDDGTRASLKESWPTDGSSPNETQAILEQRFRAALSNDEFPAEDPQESVERARKICIFLEFLAGLPTPDEEKELRMKYQVERLSASMTGERERVSARDEALDLEDQWVRLPYLPEAEYGQFKQRVLTALDAILEE